NSPGHFVEPTHGRLGPAWLARRAADRGSALRGRWNGLTLVPCFWNHGTMESAQALATLAALGHETRLAAFRTLVQAGPEGLPVGALRERLGTAPATLTAHLNVLRA